MAGCSDPDCKASIMRCLNNKVPKKVLYGAFVVFGLPLLITGIKVWSGQEADPLRYVEKKEMVEYGKEQVRLRESVDHMKKDLQEIKDGQTEGQKDIKEILRHLRKP